MFGPALPVVRVKNLEEGLALANDSIFGLGSSIWTQDIDKAMFAAEKLDAGYTWVNSAQIIYDELPFGGVKQSGVGKEHGNEAVEHYSEVKSRGRGHGANFRDGGRRIGRPRTVAAARLAAGFARLDKA